MNKFISISFVHGFHGCNKFWMQLDNGMAAILHSTGHAFGQIIRT
jgi:hypothetical protein